MKLINKSLQALSLIAIATITVDGEAQPKRVEAFIPSSATNPTGSRVEVSDEDWAILKDHPGTKRLQRRGWLVAVEEKTAEPKAAPRTSLADLNAREATAYVATVDDVEELFGLVDVETRSTVLEAIDRRISALSAND